MAELKVITLTVTLDDSQFTKAMEEYKRNVLVIDDPAREIVDDARRRMIVDYANAFSGEVGTVFHERPLVCHLGTYKCKECEDEKQKN